MNYLIKFFFSYIFLYGSLFAHDLYLNSNESLFLKTHIIKVSSTNTWAPFNFYCQKENQLISGIAIDYWKKVAKIAKIDMKIEKANSWSEVKRNIKNKKSDITLGTAKSKDKESYSIFSKPYAVFPNAIATSKNVSVILSIKELKGKKIAVGKGYSVETWLKENYPFLTLVTAKNINDALGMLDRGEVYAVIDMFPILVYTIKKNGYENIKIAGITKFNFELRFMIRNDYPQLVSVINKSIDLITEVDRDEIYQKWVTIPSKREINYILIHQIISFLTLILFLIIHRNYMLKKRNKEIELILEHMLEAIIISKNGLITEINSQFLNMMGAKDKSKILGKNMLTYVHHSSLEKLKLNLKKEETDMEEYNIKKMDGEVITILGHGKNIEIKGENVRLSSMIDISDIKKKDKLLYQQSKMASMGEMIGNIAHQWRQPLAVISMILNNMRADIELENVDNKTFIKYIIDIGKQNQYLSNTIYDFKNFFKQDLVKSEICLFSIIQETLRLINMVFKNNNINIIMDIDKSIKIKTYKNELIQAIINILNNAKDILKMSDKKKLLFIKAKQNKDVVIIEIQDSGGGIKKELIDKIFEPYFTTKHQNQGTGIGLYMTKQIIEKNIGGKIEVENSSFKYDEELFFGAKFKICVKIKGG